MPGPPTTLFVDLIRSGVPSKADFVRFTGRKAELDWQAICIHHGVNLGC
jgi:hypothetical protein